MKEASLLKLIQADAKGVYNNFMETIRLLEQVTDPQVRHLWVSDLTELHERAKQLLDTELLDHHTEPMMKMILGRSAEQWSLLTRNKHSKVM